VKTIIKAWQEQHYGKTLHFCLLSFYGFQVLLLLFSSMP